MHVPAQCISHVCIYVCMHAWGGSTYNVLVQANPIVSCHGNKGKEKGKEIKEKKGNWVCPTHEMKSPGYTYKMDPGPNQEQKNWRF